MGQSVSAGVLLASFSDEVPSAERRQDARHSATLRVGVLETAHGKQLCLVKNVSRGGLRAVVYGDVRPGTYATVVLKTGSKVDGTVVWSKDDHVGVEFDCPISVEELLATESLAADGRRSRLPRIECYRPAAIRCAAQTYAGRTIDLSQGGLKLRLSHGVPLGEAVVLLPGLNPILGSIRWSDDQYAGVSFNDLIAFRTLVEWVRTGQTVPARPASDTGSFPTVGDDGLQPKWG